MNHQALQETGAVQVSRSPERGVAFDPIKLTPQLSQAARRERGLSQRDVIQSTGIRGYKIKQWEARGLGIDLADMRKLSEFYESIGVDLDELNRYIEHGRAPVQAPEQEAKAPVARRSQAEANFLPRPGFLISADLPGAVVDKLQTDMEDSDDRIAEIVKSGLKKGIFGDLSGETEGLVQELFAHLAVNYLRFRCLQGRNIIEATRDEAKTVGDYLAQWVLGQGVVLAEDRAPDASQPRAAVGTRARVEAVEQE